MRIEIGNYCPLIQKDCMGFKCSWTVKIRGVDPNTGEEVDEYRCAITWLPMLLIENSQQQRQTGAAVESFRNEMVQANLQTANLMLSMITKDNEIKVIG